MADQYKRIKVSSPVGIAVYPKLTTPDTKFKAEGEYTCRLRVAADKAAPFVAKIDAAYNENLETTKAALQAAIESAEGTEKGKAKKALAAFKPADKPYKEALDAEGDPTGEVEFNFKLKAKVTERKTGKVRERRPTIVDSAGTVLDPDGLSIWGGSKVQVGGYLVPFNTAIGCGISLRLAQVRIIKLVSGGDEQFDYEDGDEEDDAFVAPPPKPKTQKVDDADETPSASEEDDEF
jgi:hypothetical protein